MHSPTPACLSLSKAFLSFTGLEEEKKRASTSSAKPVMGASHAYRTSSPCFFLPADTRTGSVTATIARSSVTATSSILAPP